MTLHSVAVVFEQRIRYPLVVPELRGFLGICCMHVALRVGGQEALRTQNRVRDAV